MTVTALGAMVSWSGAGALVAALQDLHAVDRSDPDGSRPGAEPGESTAFTKEETQCLTKS